MCVIGVVVGSLNKIIYFTAIERVCGKIGKLAPAVVWGTAAEACVDMLQCSKLIYMNGRHHVDVTPIWIY